MNKPYLTAEAVVDVPFHDVDAMEVVWHGCYVKYFEHARTLLLRQIDFDYPQMQAAGYTWPVVECYLKYVQPARYGNRLIVHAELIEYQNRLRINYEIREEAGGKRLTKGYTTQVAVRISDGELQYASPECLTSRLEQL